MASPVPDFSTLGITIVDVSMLAHFEAVAVAFFCASGGGSPADSHNTTIPLKEPLFFFNTRDCRREIIKVGSQPDIAGRETFRICKFSAVRTRKTTPHSWDPRFRSYRVTRSNTFAAKSPRRPNGGLLPSIASPSRQLCYNPSALSCSESYFTPFDSPPPRRNA